MVYKTFEDYVNQELIFEDDMILISQLNNCSYYNQLLPRIIYKITENSIGLIDPDTQKIEWHSISKVVGITDVIKNV